MTAGVLKKKKKSETHKGYTERFLIIRNKAECKLSRESSSSKPRTIQKQTNSCYRLGSSRRMCARDVFVALKKRISSKIGIVLFCVIKARSVEPLSVFDLCSIIIVCKQKGLTARPIFRQKHPGYNSVTLVQDFTYPNLLIFRSLPLH